MQNAIATDPCEQSAPSRSAARMGHLEREFYEQYAWCLNPFPTVREVIEHLREHIDGLAVIQEDWRQEELLRNIALLCCALSDSLDDYLGGTRYDFSQAAAVFGPSRLVVKPMNRLVRLGSDAKVLLRQGLSAWRDQWETAVGDFMADFASCTPDDRRSACPTGASLRNLLDRNLPGSLLSSRVRIPAAFRSQDLTHFDAFLLGKKFIDAFPDRTRPILVVGLRTAGSYFGPLLRGYLKNHGFDHVDSVTLRPKRGVGVRESACLSRAATGGALAVIIDEPVYSASTVAKSLTCLKNAGFSPDRIVVSFPVHPKRQDWMAGVGRLLLGDIRVLTLEPSEWHKAALLETSAASRRIREYYEADAEVTAEVKSTDASELATAALEKCFEPGMHWRLKRIFQVELHHPNGYTESQFVLAKSVGWGWLGYHAFLAGTRLAGLVPRVLGQRDGILYMHWSGNSLAQPETEDRTRLINFAASYIGARVRKLALPQDPTRDLVRAGRHRGTEELAGVLSGAYGWKIGCALKRPGIQHQLAALPCPVPTLIDGKMRLAEWVDLRDGFVKADYEHHGMGKHELNLTDPAFDLAEVILECKLGAEEEQRLISQYVECSGDADVFGRLFLYKLLAGTWAMAHAVDNLKSTTVLERHTQFNQRFLEASRFLTLQTARYCGALCRKSTRPVWSSPLMVLDVDGVLDSRTFGFPSTTMAGVEAVSLLAAHGVSAVLNTARSVTEMKEYCKAYGFLGGVAEYGAFAWDAVSNREQILVDAEPLAQLETLKAAIRGIPGVFLDDDCRFMVKAYSYGRGRTIPLPDTVMRDLIGSLGLDRLQLHQTYTDSTVIAAEVDKGSGLAALLSLAGVPGVQTIAVGDSEPDLPMFRAATRCFAPAQISCPQPARLLGCVIASRPYQSGLLEIVRSIVHPNGARCASCEMPGTALEPADELFVRLLRIADRSRLGLFARALFDPKSIHAFSQ